MKKLSIIFLALLMLVGCATKETPKLSEDDEITIYVMRHGKTMLNTTDLAQGWADAPLTPAGIKKIEGIAEAKKDLDIDVAYSSDSGRSIETATIVLSKNQNNDIELKQKKDFREFNMGSFEGLPNDELTVIAAEYLGVTYDEYAKMMETQTFYTKVQDWSNSMAKKDREMTDPETNWLSEDYETVTIRVNKAMKEIVEEMTEKGQKNALVVSHGMTIGALVESIDPKFELPEWGPSNGSIVKITYKAGVFTVNSYE